MFSVILALIIIICLYKLFKRSEITQPPGPWNLPILGSLYLLDEKEPYESLARLSKKYGPIYSLKLGTINTVVIAEPRLLKKVLMNDKTLERPPLYFYELMLKRKGLLFAGGDLWKDQRKFVVDYLRMSGAAKVSSKKQVFENQVRANMEEFIQYIKKQGDEVTLDPSEAIAHFASSTSTTLFLGKSQSRDDKKTEILAKHVAQIAACGVMSGPINFLPFLRFLPKFKQALSTVSDLQGKVYNILNEYISEGRENDSSFNFIQKFLEIKSNPAIYNNEQLRCLLFDVFAASIETTTHSIWWIVLYLSAYPQVQQKVRKEITDVLQGREPEFDDLAYSPYTEATIAEVARIRTIAPLGFPHDTMDDVQVENFTIRKGTTIMPLLWAIHMDPTVWNQPEVFNPERFLDDEGKFFQPESFMPFQTGKRKCPGDELAKMLIFIFVVKLVQNFSLPTSGSVDLSGICGATFVPKRQNIVFKKI